MAKYIVGDIFKGDFPISQYYGNNPAYYAQFGFNGHEGVDWATPVGVDVLAPFKRNIILQDQDDPKSGAYGDYIVVWDPDQKCAVWYCHLSLNDVDYNKEYSQGTVLGKTGNTGNTTGPHLHVNFVETDANGARQNMANGFKGMLNILDPNLVQWQLSGQQATIPQAETTYRGYDLTNQDSMKVAVDVLVRVQGGEFIDKSKYDADIKSKEDTIANLNTQISKLTSEHSSQTTEIGSLNAQLTTLQTQIETLQGQANDGSVAQTNLNQITKDYNSDKIRWAAYEETTNRQIAQLKNSSFKEANNTKLIGEIIRRIFHINN